MFVIYLVDSDESKNPEDDKELMINQHSFLTPNIDTIYDKNNEPLLLFHFPTTLPKMKSKNHLIRLYSP